MLPHVQVDKCMSKSFVYKIKKHFNNYNKLVSHEYQQAIFGKVNIVLLSPPVVHKCTCQQVLLDLVKHTPHSKVWP